MMEYRELKSRQGDQQETEETRGKRGVCVRVESRGGDDGEQSGKGSRC